MRRVLDVIASLTLGLCTLPLMLAIGAVVAIHIGRPVLFRQARIGLGGQTFLIVKFRTMVSAPPGTPAPARTSALGNFLRRYSLDELPELWNVLIGDMSIIGPRPLLKIEQPRDLLVRRLRQCVRPGITGLAQVSGRNAITPERKFELDLQWIRTRSAPGDLLIFLSTLFCVIFLTSRHRAGGATMAQRKRKPIGHAPIRVPRPPSGLGVVSPALKGGSVAQFDMARNEGEDRLPPIEVSRAPQDPAFRLPHLR